MTYNMLIEDRASPKFKISFYSRLSGRRHG